MVGGADLAGPGWRLAPGNSAHARGTAGGNEFEGGDVTGAVTMLPAFTPVDVPHVAIEERAFVAAEITAFVLAWLSQLSCRVLNRPTPGCLSGPAWPPEQWVLVAAQLRVPAWPLHRSARLNDAKPDLKIHSGRPMSVTVVGDRCTGFDDGVLRSHARALAEAVGIEFLTAEFAPRHGESVLMNVRPAVNLADPESMNAIADYFDASVDVR